jgi:DnaJ-class molecular chaperone
VLWLRFRETFQSPAGNGKCVGCHGTGFGAFFDVITMEFLSPEPPSCDECYGTGKCQRCRGTGVIKEPRSKSPHSAQHITGSGP